MEITSKPLNDTERLFLAPPKKVNAGISLPVPESPPATFSGTEIISLILRLVSDGYSVTEVCAVEGFPTAGEFLLAADADPSLKASLRHAMKIRGMVLREARLVNARSSGNASAFEMTARDVHIVDAPETSPSHKIEHSGGVVVQHSLTDDEIIARYISKTTGESPTKKD